jgi:general secretion pathway protein I
MMRRAAGRIRPVKNHTSVSMLCCERRGLSLLEVLVSVAIFLGALTAIMQLLNSGQQSEVSARLKTEAALRCEAKMAEIVSGIEEAVSSDEQKFPDDEIGNWQWSADVGSSSATSLLKITVTVEHLPDGKNPNAAFTLSRYMRDPQLFIDAALSEAGE